MDTIVESPISATITIPLPLAAADRFQKMITTAEEKDDLETDVIVIDSGFMLAIIHNSFGFQRLMFRTLV